MARQVLQSVNVGPNGNSLYVLRVVDDSTQEIVAVEVVNIRGQVVWDAHYLTESGARAMANRIWKTAKENNGWRPQ